VKKLSILSPFTLLLIFAPIASWAASGDLDRSYGVNGIADIQTVNPYSLAIQTDNKIVIGGQC
jgi:hypothetical protein